MDKLLVCRTKAGERQAIEHFEFTLADRHWKSQYRTCSTKRAILLHKLFHSGYINKNSYKRIDDTELILRP